MGNENFKTIETLAIGKSFKTVESLAVFEIFETFETLEIYETFKIVTILAIDENFKTLLIGEKFKASASARCFYCVPTTYATRHDIVGLNEALCHSRKTCLRVQS